MNAARLMSFYLFVLGVSLISAPLQAALTLHKPTISEKEKQILADYLKKNYSTQKENPAIHEYASKMLNALSCQDYIKTSWLEGKKLAMADAGSFKEPSKIYNYYKDAGINLFGEGFDRSGKSIIKALSKLHKLFAVDLESDLKIKKGDLKEFFASIENKEPTRYTLAERAFVREFYALTRELNEVSEDLGIPCDKKLRKPTENKDDSERAQWGKVSENLVVDDPMSFAEQSSSCRKAIPRNVRSFAFQHFGLFLRSKMRNGKNATSADIELFSKRLSYIVKESYNGFTTTVTDMRHRGTGSDPFKKENPKGLPLIGWLIGQNKIYERENVKTSLKSWREAINIDHSKPSTRIDKQTNYGILQMSADRLTYPKSGIKTRQLLSSLQSAAINDHDALLDYCQTEKFFKDSRKDILSAFKGIATCQTSQSSNSGIKCFGAWAMLCPGFNYEIGLMAPEAYFAKQTRNESPRVCREAFKSILDQYRKEFPKSGL